MNIKRRLTAIGLICSLMVLIFGGGRSPTTVYADTVEHTHIWATTYDATNHWEYCTVCGEKRNVTAHTFTDHLYSNSGACGGKASNKTCDCGYGYTYVPQHVKAPTVHSATGSVRVHYWICKNCGSWVSCEACRNQNGFLNCKNPGTCSVCGGVWPVGRHYIFGGRCIDCGKQIYTITNNTQTYNADYSKVTYSFDVVPQTDNVEVVDSTCYCSGTSNCKKLDRNLKKNNDGSYTITWIMTLDPTKATNKMTPCWRYNNVTVDGYTCYVQEECFHEFWMDHTAPIVSDIKQTDQKSYNGYATIKQLDISGTEDYANQITLSISDKATGKVMVDKAKIPVTDNKWSYTCTPPLEADENGRTYVVRTEDVNGNVSTKEFTIFKTDGTAPQVESPLSYKNWTAKAKTITLTISDYGSGSPQASLEDQTHYKACTKVGDKYQITYTFNDDIVGAKNYDLYLKDALGNARKVTLTVGNIDKNTYTITYNLNSGSSGTALKTTYTVEDAFTLPQPTKTGYTFTGWTGTSLSSYTKSVTIPKGSSGNRSYTANWIPNGYILTFNYNRPRDSSYETMSGNSTASKGVSYNAGYGVLPGPALQGWKFAGWFTAASGGSQVINTTKYTTVGNQTLYAHWTPITWTVKYDANGGSGTIADTKHAYMTVVKLNKNTFFRNGYTFNGWQASRIRNGKTEWLCGNADGSWISGGEWHEEGNIPSNRKIYRFADCQIMYRSTYTDGDVITCHAQWTVNTYTNNLRHWACGLKYGEGNNGDKDCFLIGDTPYTKNYGETYVMDDSWLIKIPNGYYSTRTTGFYTFSSNGTTNGFITRGFGYKFTQNDNNSYENLYHELYYRPYDYTITYNLNGGTNNSVNPSTYNVLYGVSLKAPTRAGYTFTGWYDQNGNKITGINEGCNATFSSADDLYTKLAARTTGNRTLTAHWSYNPVSVKVPQILTGDHTGKSQFRVKCDDLKAGNIKINVPASFNYKQAGKTDVTAAITAKSGSNTITPTNKVCVYDITTKSGLTAGCWQGNFNIGLTLTKE